MKIRETAAAAGKIDWGHLIPRSVAVFLLVLALGGPARASGKSGCRAGEGRVTKKVAGFEIVLGRDPDDETHEASCQATVFDPDQKAIFTEHDWGFFIVLAGEDVNGDGVSDVILEGYSGGAHCCWTYYFISLGAHPGRITQFENQRDLSAFRNPKNGRIEFATLDGAFDYFDDLCHACTPFPAVYLRLDGSRFVDIGPEHIADYDEIITEQKKTLTARELQRFRALQTKPTEAEGKGETIFKVLTIVFAYLYSGREAQAHRALQDMWPPSDLERMWELILETRRNGVLSYTPPAMN